jgi:colicin import membrane protein
MIERSSDKWVGVTLSVVVHGVIAALLIWGFWFYKSDPLPPPQLAIEATVVDSRTLAADVLKPAREAAPVPTPAPPTPEPPAETPPAETPPPEPAPPTPEPPPEDPAKLERERAQKALQQRQEREERAERDKRQEQQRVAAEKEKARQETERVAHEKAQKEKERVEREKADQEKTEQLARQKAADERQRQQRESELRAQLAAEERVTAARSSGLMQQYLAQIRGRIERAWIRPPGARPGLSCEVRITQVPGGEVVGVQVQACNGDDAVRQSIEAAAYRASPLPNPPDPALFDRNLVVTFRPED